MLVTASFGRILSNSLLALFEHGRRLNVHPSLLPTYRGAAPIQRALLDGQKETGVCVIEMMERKKGIDAGEIWGRRRMVGISLSQRVVYLICLTGHSQWHCVPRAERRIGLRGWTIAGLCPP